MKAVAFAVAFAFLSTSFALAGQAVTGYSGNYVPPGLTDLGVGQKGDRLTPTAAAITTPAPSVDQALANCLQTEDVETCDDEADILSQAEFDARFNAGTDKLTAQVTE